MNTKVLNVSQHDKKIILYIIEYDIIDNKNSKIKF